MNHFISNATPRHQSMPLSVDSNSTKKTPLSKTFNLNKVGHSEKIDEKVKKKLAYSENSETLSNKKKN